MRLFGLKPCSGSFVTVFSLLCLCPVAIQAASAQDELKALSPTTDEVVAPVLSGGVRQTDVSGAGGGGSEKADSDLNEKNPKNSQRLFGGFFGRRMASDDFRKMEFGILGMVSQKSFWAAKYTVSEVLPGCPAALAGIRPGDVELETNGHVWTRQDDQASYWKITDGKAGTPVELKILRKGETLTFNLVRMNIEDIPDERIRRVFERMVAKYGSGE